MVKLIDELELSMTSGCANSGFPTRHNHLNTAPNCASTAGGDYLEILARYGHRIAAALAEALQQFSQIASQIGSLRLALIVGLLRAAYCVVREDRAYQQCEPVKIDQAEMADRVEPVGVVQWQRYRHSDYWGEEGAPERPAHAVADAKPGQGAKYGITSLAAAPTAYRLLMAAGADLARQSQAGLRVACSAGEPLNPEVIRWAREHLGCAVYDHYGQTELGMVACNHHALQHPVQPSSMGLSAPGFRIVALDEHGNEVGPGQSGQLAVDRAASPLYYFQGYWQQDSRDRYHGQYYLTGDRVEVGADGNFIFMGRDDDIIMYAGYRIGPFEVESSLLEHPAVAESAVVGKPDTERGEIVKAFVVLRSGYAPSAELASELQHHVRQRLSAHAYPREVEFMNSLPKTPSGKIQRFVLRQQASVPSQ
jgi:acyl-CoA synthetase (AMP-forming)/AMP-acid ligase II